MFKSIRQSMAWLHSWLGLFFGWFIFIIFLTGSLSYYKYEINLWSEPQIAHYQIEQNTSIQTAYQYLLENADNNAKEWHITLAQENKSPINQVFWFDDNNFQQSSLDPETGETLLLDNEFPLGEFLYRFHYQFYGTPVLATRLFVAFITFILLLTLISGIITHKKIFSDFFTLRTFKSQRSWLDVHNISAVLATPFFITMTFTGLMFFFYLYLPQGFQQFYTENSKANYFKEIKEKTPILIQKNTENKSDNEENNPSKNLDLDYFLTKVNQEWGDAKIARIAILNPNQDNAIIRFEQLRDHSIIQNPARLTFNMTTGEYIADYRNRSAIAQIHSAMYGLHLAPFAQSFFRLTLFFSGLLGCIMIATGLLLWSIKRQIKNQEKNESLGHFFVDRLNIAILVGLPIAIIGSFYAVRLDAFIHIIGLDEFFGFPFISSFFFLWLFSFIISLLTPKVKLWTSQLIVLMIFCFTLPIVNLIYLIQQDFVNNLSSYWLFFRIDIFILLLGIFAVLIFKYIKPIQLYGEQKIKKSLEQKS